MSLFARKSIDELRADAFQEGENTLKRELTATNLVLLGIGAIIGTGIFVLTGTAAAQYSGPAVVYSFMLAGTASLFAGLCYAEFAAMIPIAGSAYTYGYATLGEFVAWIIGWDLILEYMFGAATVGVGWSGYVASFLADIGLALPPEFTNAPGRLIYSPTTETWLRQSEAVLGQLTAAGLDPSTLPQTVAVFNVVAALGILAVTALLVVGIKESARFNNVAVAIKLFVLLVFIVVGLYYISNNMAQAIDNWTPFVPQGTADGRYGWDGIVTAAGVVFFAYIGFDAVSTTAQEAKNPQRDMPIGILGSLAVCTILYIIVSGILTGLVAYELLNVPEPIALGMDATGFEALASMVKIGAIAGLSTVMLVMLMSQPRIFYTMSKDGLLPGVFSRLHPKFRTPHISTMMTGAVCALVAGLFPVGLLGELVSIGTLLAFGIVCAGVWYLRVKEPDRERPFRTPLVPLVPILGILSCGYLMYGLPWDTWLRLLIWMAVGLVVYFTYSRKHSLLRLTGMTGEVDVPPGDTYTEPKDEGPPPRR